jgi:hypothetical protein
MPKLLTRIVAVLLIPSLMAGNLQAAGWTGAYASSPSMTASRTNLAAEAFCQPGNVFHRSFTRTTAVAVAVSATLLLTAFRVNFHPKIFVLVLSALALSGSAILGILRIKRFREDTDAFKYIHGLPEAGPAQAGIDAEWNDVGHWRRETILLSDDETKLAVIARGIAPEIPWANDGLYLVEYDRDPLTGMLTNGEVVKRLQADADHERFAQDLFYSKSNRIGFMTVVTRVERKEGEGNGTRRDRFTGLYRIYQRALPVSMQEVYTQESQPLRIRITQEFLAYWDSDTWLAHWFPRLSPKWDRVMMPAFDPKLQVSSKGQALLIDVPFNPDVGKLNTLIRRELWRGGQLIPGSDEQEFDPRSPLMQYSFRNGGNAILIAQEGQFYEIRAVRGWGHADQLFLHGTRLSYSSDNRLTRIIALFMRLLRRLLLLVSPSRRNGPPSAPRQSS